MTINPPSNNPPPHEPGAQPNVGDGDLHQEAVAYDNQIHAWGYTWDYALADWFANATATHDTVTEMQTFMSSPEGFGVQDVYMQFTQADTQTIGQIFSDCGLPMPNETSMDQSYREGSSLWSQRPSSDPASQMWSAFSKEMWNLGSNSSMEDLQTWMNNQYGSKDIYMSYPGINPNDGYDFYILCGVANPPAPTPMDTAYTNAYNWLHSQPPLTGQALQLATDLYNAFSPMNSDDDLSKLQTSFLGQFTSSDDIFFYYKGGISQADANMAYSICYGTNTQAPTETPMDGAYSSAYQWLNSQPPLTGQTLQLAQDLYNAFSSMQSDDDLSQLQTSFLGQFTSSDDIFFYYKGGISQADADMAYSICGETAPTETAMDSAYGSAYQWLNQQPPLTGQTLQLATDLYNAFSSLHSDDDLSQLQNLFLGQFTSSDDIFFYYKGGISQADANMAYSICGETAPSETAMDTTYSAAYQWLYQQPPLTGPTLQLAQALYNAIQPLGSDGTAAQLQLFLNKFTASSDVFYQYVGISQGDANTFYGILGTIIQPPPTVPTPTEMDTSYLNSYNWLNQQPPLTGPDLLLATDLFNKFKSFGSNELSQFQTWFQSQFITSSNDVFMQYGGVSQSAVNELYSLYNANSVPPTQAPTPTAMDISYFSTLRWINQKPPISPDDLKLAEAVMGKITTLGSNPSDPNAFNTWALAIYNNSFAGYPYLSPAAKSQFVQITGADPFTSIQTAIQNYYNTIYSTASAYFTANNLGSFPPPDWNTLIAQYKGNPTIDNMLIQFNSELLLFGVGTPTPPPGPGVLGAIATLFSEYEPVAALQDWASTINLGPPDYPNLTAADIAEFKKYLYPPAS